MICERMSPLLDDLVDGSLSAAEAALVREHLATCRRCSDEDAELRALRAATGRLPVALEPARDLWPSIRARIAFAQATERGAEARLPGRGQWITSLAAAVVVAVALAVALVSGPVGRPATPLEPGGREIVPAVADVAAVGARYEVARRELQAALDSRRAQLAPETQRTIDENLAVIDAAVAQIGAALERDPGNRDLAGLLVATCERQVEVLERFVRVVGRG